MKLSNAIAGTKFLADLILHWQEYRVKFTKKNGELERTVLSAYRILVHISVVGYPAQYRISKKSVPYVTLSLFEQTYFTTRSYV